MTANTCAWATTTATATKTASSLFSYDRKTANASTWNMSKTNPAARGAATLSITARYGSGLMADGWIFADWRLLLAAQSAIIALVRSAQIICTYLCVHICEAVCLCIWRIADYIFCIISCMTVACVLLFWGSDFMQRRSNTNFWVSKIGFLCQIWKRKKKKEISPQIQILHLTLLSSTSVSATIHLIIFRLYT